MMATALAMLARTSQSASVPTPTTSNVLIAYPVALLAAGLVYNRWPMVRSRMDTWLVMTLVFVGVQGLGLAALAEGLLPLPASRGAWLAVIDLAVALVALGVVGMTERVDLRVNPIVAGFAAGLGLTGACALVLHYAPPWPVAASATTWLAGGLVLANVAIGWRVLQLQSLSIGVRVRFAGTAVLLGISTAASASGTQHGTTARVVVIAADVTCAIILITVAAGLVLRSLSVQTSIGQLHRKITELQADQRGDRARLHEINATLAGLACASTLMQSPGSLPARSRVALEEMMHAELMRLQRLMNQAEEATCADVDEAVRHLVVAHEARGHTVHFSPAGLCATADADAVTEVVNILLDNAYQHGSAETEVVARLHHDEVEIIVSDHGPGIAPEVQDHLFEWGVRGPGSRGHGTGLGIADDLVRRQGGDLELTATSPGGTVFTLTLPRHPTSTVVPAAASTVVVGPVPPRVGPTVVVPVTQLSGASRTGDDAVARSA